MTVLEALEFASREKPNTGIVLIPMEGKTLGIEYKLADNTFIYNTSSNKLTRQAFEQALKEMI